MGGALALEDRGALGTSFYLIRECGFADGSCAPALRDEYGTECEMMAEVASARSD